MSTTSPANPTALPDAWIGRLFGRMEALYGSLFLDRWKHCDMANVRRVWAEELSGFHDQPAMLAHALRSLDSVPMPPTLPEFLALCRQAPRPQHLALPAPEVPVEVRKERARTVARLADGFGGRDPLDWARRPRSLIAFAAVQKLAADGDDRFAEIAEELKREGICSDDCRLMRCWNGLEWRPC